MNQQITFLTDGADSLRRMVGNMSPCAEHYIDWFRIAMRFTALGQFVKGLAHHQPDEAAALEGRLDRIKWRLWHGDGREAVIRLDALAEDVDALECDYPSLKGSVAKFGLEHILQQYSSMNSMQYYCGMTAENRLLQQNRGNPGQRDARRHDAGSDFNGCADEGADRVRPRGGRAAAARGGNRDAGRAHHRAATESTMRA
jgi:hypothetical protein